MRAFVCRSYDDTMPSLAVEELDAPPLPAGSVRLRVHAAGVNFADTLIVRGRYQEKPTPPFAPGMEAAGVVIETTAGVAHVRPGDRVLALLDHGGFAEEAVAVASDVVPIPDSMDFVTAAGFPVTYATSYLALARARLAPDERLVVTGASGGVGLTAVEVGRAMGATVTAIASSEEKLAVTREHGAARGINSATEDVAQRVRELTDGADVVFDTVGGELFAAALHCIRPGGRILVIGFASGVVPQVPANHLLVKDASVLGFSLGQMRRHQPSAVRSGLAKLLRWYEQGKLRPRVSQILPLERAAEALSLIESRRVIGKLVLAVVPEG